MSTVATAGSDKIKRVSGPQSKEGKVKREKKPRVSWDFTTATDALGNPIPLSEGKLTAIPNNVPKKGIHPLKEENFANGGIWARYQSARMARRAELMTKRSKDLAAAAEYFDKHGKLPERSSDESKANKKLSELETLLSKMTPEQKAVLLGKLAGLGG